MGVEDVSAQAGLGGAAMAAATIVHDTSEAVELCAAHGLYLKPITKMTISVALPQLKQPGKSISNWEVMERLKAMVHSHQFSTLRIAKSTMDFIRFEGEVENRGLVKAFLACLDGKTIKLSGFSDALRVRAAEFKPDFPTRHDWDSFFRDAEDMNETLPGERPDTIHLEGLPCKWFAARDPDAAASSAAASSASGGGGSGGGGSGAGAPERPSEDVLVRVFRRFGDIRNVDIPMLDPYREEMTGRNFHTFSFGGHLNFEAYVQYREYAGFIQAMSALRGMKLMFKGDDGKAVACNIKVSFDSTKHLSDASIRKRQLERQKLQELEQQREEQKRREKEAEERQRAEERRQKEQEQQERARRREEKLRRREQRQRARELRRSQRKLEKLQAEEQRRLHERIRMEERKLLLAQRNLQSIRLVAELLSRAEAARQAALAHSEERQRRQRLELRRRQEAELRRVEEEKRRALGLQRRERELRGRLLGLLLSRRPDAPAVRGDLLQPVLDILHCVSGAAAAAPPAAPPDAAGGAGAPAADALADPGAPEPHGGGGGVVPPRAPPAAGGDKDARPRDKCNREPPDGGPDPERPAEEARRPPPPPTPPPPQPRREPRKERAHRKRPRRDREAPPDAGGGGGSPRRGGDGEDKVKERRGEAGGRRERGGRGGEERRRSRHRRRGGGDARSRSRSRSAGRRRRGAWDDRSAAGRPRVRARCRGDRGFPAHRPSLRSSLVAFRCMKGEGSSYDRGTGSDVSADRKWKGRPAPSLLGCPRVWVATGSDITGDRKWTEEPFTWAQGK
uniref:A-kinase anchor protein 17A n=1 Tax=Jaculus jaculus TaxID=51337 RepID=UPI001E1B1D37|nr:A-kinase anchor protein 17A [Jaculus jaculus]